MKYVYIIFLTALIFWNLHSFLGKVNSLIVFDIDLVRLQFLEETRYMYMQGCLQGHKHYSIAPKPVVGFDADSPTVYCSDWADRNLDYLQQQAGKLGRKTE